MTGFGLDSDLDGPAATRTGALLPARGPPRGGDFSLGAELGEPPTRLPASRVLLSSNTARRLSATKPAESAAAAAALDRPLMYAGRVGGERLPPPPTATGLGLFGVEADVDRGGRLTRGPGLGLAADLAAGPRDRPLSSVTRSGGDYGLVEEGVLARRPIAPSTVGGPYGLGGDLMRSGTLREHYGLAAEGVAPRRDAPGGRPYGLDGELLSPEVPAAPPPLSGPPMAELIPGPVMPAPPPTPAGALAEMHAPDLPLMATADHLVWFPNTGAVVVPPPDVAPVDVSGAPPTPGTAARGRQSASQLAAAATAAAGLYVPEGDAGADDPGGAAGVGTTKLERRLVHEAGPAPSLWFDRDGRLTLLPSPLARARSRPPYRSDAPRPHLETVHVAPSLALTGGGGAVYRLRVDITRLELAAHPLQAHEDYLAARLTAAVREHARRSRSGLATFYGDKAAALTESYLAAAAALPPGGGVGGGSEASRLESLESEVLDTRRLRDGEAASTAELLAVMRACHAGMVQARATQGFATTALALDMSPPTPAAVAAFTRALHARAAADAACDVAIAAARHARAGAEAAAGRLRSLSSLVTALQRRGLLEPAPPPPLPAGGSFAQREAAAREAATRDAAAAASGVPPRQQLARAPRTPDEATALRHLEDLAGAVASNAPTGGAFDRDAAAEVAAAVAARSAAVAAAAFSAVPTLIAATGRDVGDALPPAEQLRRSRLARTRVYGLLVTAGGDVVGRTAAVTLGSDLTASLEHTFTLAVRRAPDGLALRLYERAGALPADSLLAEVALGVPGAAGGALADPAPLAYQWRAGVPFTPAWDGDERARHAAAIAAAAAAGDPLARPPTLAPAPGVYYASGAVWVRSAWLSPLDPRAKDAKRGGGRVRAAITTGATARDVERGTLSDGDTDGDGDALPQAPPVTAVATAAGAHAHQQSLLAAAGGAGGGVGRANSPPGSPGRATAAAAASWRRGAATAVLADPNDPRGAAMRDAAAAAAVAALAPGSYRLAGGGDELALPATPVTALGGGNARRLQLLSARWDRGLTGLEIPLADATPGDAPRLADLLASLQGGSRPTALPTLATTAPGVPAPTTAQAVEARAARASAFADRVAHRLRTTRWATAAGSGPRMKRPPALEDVVKDSTLPEFLGAIDFTAFLAWFAPVRPLRPSRRLGGGPAGSNRADGCDIVVVVQKGFRLPSRGAGWAGVAPRGGPAPGAFGLSAELAAFDGVQSAPSATPGAVALGGALAQQQQMRAALRPFVEVSLEGRTRRTRTLAGTEPVWNESLTLPYRPPGGDLTPSALARSTAALTVTLFDEEDLTAPGGGSRAAGALARHYLGAIRIPVAAIHRAAAGVLEGAIAIDTPTVLLSYVRPAGDATLSLYVVLQPKVNPAAPAAPEVASGEDGDVGRAAQLWQAGLQQKAVCRGRDVAALAADANGSHLLLTRFVSPTAPPPGLLPPDGGGEAGLRRLLRFAQLLPAWETAPAGYGAGGGDDATATPGGGFADDAPGLPDSGDVPVWATSAESVTLAAAGAAERALLLCGLFTHAGLRSMVALGSGVRRARGVYVITLEGPTGGLPTAAHGAALQVRVWDATTGRVWSARDAACELRQVGTVFDAANVWANVQPRAEPGAVQWDLSIPYHWRPLFPPVAVGAPTPPRLGTVQPEVVYAPPAATGGTGAAFASDLAMMVEKEMAEAIQAARPHKYTPMNRRCSRALKALLADVEAHTAAAAMADGPEAAAAAVAAGMAVGTGAPPPAAPAMLHGKAAALNALAAAHLAEVQREARAVKVRGYTLQLPHTGAAAVRAAVLATQAHATAEDVEFAVAAHVEPYGAPFVCAVWMYVAVLVKA